MVRSRPCSTSGSQAWAGARPSFNARAVVAIARGRGCDICSISHWPENHAFVVLAKRSVAAAVAWARKYLVVASIARGWCCLAIRGRMARVLISRPIHASSQWELEIVMVVPRPRPRIRIK